MGEDDCGTWESDQVPLKSYYPYGGYYGVDDGSMETDSDDGDDDPMDSDSVNNDAMDIDWNTNRRNLKT